MHLHDHLIHRETWKGGHLYSLSLLLATPASSSGATDASWSKSIMPMWQLRLSWQLWQWLQLLQLMLPEASLLEIFLQFGNRCSHGNHTNVANMVIVATVAIIAMIGKATWIAAFPERGRRESRRSPSSLPTPWTTLQSSTSSRSPSSPPLHQGVSQSQCRNSRARSSGFWQTYPLAGVQTCQVLLCNSTRWGWMWSRPVWVCSSPYQHLVRLRHIQHIRVASAKLRNRW